MCVTTLRIYLTVAFNADIMCLALTFSDCWLRLFHVERSMLVEESTLLTTYCGTAPYYRCGPGLFVFSGNVEFLLYPSGFHSVL